MSSKNFNNKDKILNGLMVVNSEDAWSNSKLRDDLVFFGKVKTRTSGCVVKANNQYTKSGFVEDFSNLNKNTKNDIISRLNMPAPKGGNRSAVYLVRSDSSALTTSKKKKELEKLKSKYVKENEKYNAANAQKRSANSNKSKKK